MTMEESIIKSAKLYNRATDTKVTKERFNRFIGKLLMYHEVTSKMPITKFSVDGKISIVEFGEDVREV